VPRPVEIGIVITILTATLNAAECLPQLAADLLAQSDTDFEWIVVDGGSTDGTLDAIPAQLAARTRVLRETDFGIYDAINKGLRACRSEHYVVVGADDRLTGDAVARFAGLARETNADIVALSVAEGTRVTRPGRGLPWLRGHRAYIAQHSVGALFRVALHARVGFYSNRYPIAADQRFVLAALSSGATLHCAPEFIAGRFAQSGVSSTRFTACLFEFTLVQLEFQPWRSLQLLLFVLRLLRHLPRVLQR
jgi:glycosyltransferase involved in cell wall biosynthesis